MKSFSYQRKPNAASNIFARERRKVNIQRWIYIIAFTLLLISLGVYLLTNALYLRLEGTTNLSNYNYRLMEDVLITKVWVKPGDSVKSGDNLFSYIPTKTIVALNDVMEYSWIDREVFQMEKTIETKKIEIDFLKQQIENQEQEYSYIKNHVFTGVTSERELYDVYKKYNDLLLKKELAQANLRIDQQRYNDLMDQNHSIKRAYSNPLNEANSLAASDGSTTSRVMSVNDYKAPFDGMVVTVNFQQFENAFKEEKVMEIRPASSEYIDMHVLAYIKPTDMKYVHIGDTVSISLGRDIQLDGVISVFMFNSQELPDQSKTSFDKAINMVVARVDFLTEDIPTVLKVNDVAVKVRKLRSKKQR